MTRATPERYEQSDAHARPLVYAALALALVLGASLAVSAWISQGLTDRIRASDVPDPARELRRPADSPELQALPGRELEQLQAREAHLLEAIEWIDPVNGILRIPIEDALAISLREGFPTREQKGER